MTKLNSIVARSALAIVPLMLLALPQSAHAAERMTREKMVEYYKLFSADDPRYGNFLADDVVFPHLTGGLLRGKKAVMDHYRKMMESGVVETREPTAIVIDNENGTMAVELTIHLSAAPGATPKLPTGEVLNAGDVIEGKSVLFYTIKDGKITSIRGASSGPGKFAKIK